MTRSHSSHLLVSPSCPFLPPFTLSLQNDFYYFTTLLGIPTLLCINLHPASLLHHSCILYQLASSCVILVSSLHLCLVSPVVSLSLECFISSLDWNKSIPFTVAIFPCVLITCYLSLCSNHPLSFLTFQSPAPCSVIQSIPPFSLPFHY